MRLISFPPITPFWKNYAAGTKVVTRRLGWKFARAGMPLRVVDQVQGLRRGQHPKTVGYIELIGVTDEPLMRLLTDPDYGTQEMINEGCPMWTPKQFIMFFCRMYDIKSDQLIRRLEFKKIEVDDGR